ncbi:hypothetical protein EV643_12887 [Kribbella sp. VKM Ac-2527]|uniref:Homeodomain-like domain-containing protein n=1 Tax=Kribbella caucasensis TaxID=2512215 RepID=A0A4R6JF70_9ACTN|nr:XRE family transcriptional regulator [Kribbella sp. VKM Ac-2527]TDO34302.1 hypothetical protein EV643_12887 [Kribbella sp. VKM Ac-2527]
MKVIEEWTGRHARALQAAMRLTNEAFAGHLGVAPRTVSKWRKRPDMVPSPQLQEALDTSLGRANSETRARFAAGLGEELPDPVEEEKLDQAVLTELNVAVTDLARVVARLLPREETPAH